MLFSYEMEKVYVIPENEDELYEAYFCLIKNNDKVWIFRDVKNEYFLTFWLKWSLIDFFNVIKNNSIPETIEIPTQKLILKSNSLIPTHRMNHCTIIA